MRHDDDDYLCQLDELPEQLADIGEEVSKVAILLRSVQKSYVTLVTALLAQEDNKLASI